MGAALQLADQSYAAGAAAVVSAAPYYLPMTQRDLIEYTEEFAGRLPLPLLLYNMPSCTKTAYDVDTVRTLAGHQNIIGLKDTSGDLDYYAEVAKFANSRTD
jgi:4-hydroxy-tetrahydrodipicolinate synthase